MRDINTILHEPLLKEKIFIHHDEGNIMNVKILMVGDEETPYEFGFFYFFLTFSENYPFSPPSMKFLTSNGQTRFNPNLYVNGKVCLSLLNTWSGPKWTACNSLKSLLLSIKSMIMGIKYPLENEPGYELTSKKRNELSMKTKGQFSNDYEKYNSIIEYQTILHTIINQYNDCPIGMEVFRDITEYFMKENSRKIYEKIKQNMLIYDKKQTYLNYCAQSQYFDYQLVLRKFSDTFHKYLPSHVENHVDENIFDSIVCMDIDDENSKKSESLTLKQVTVHSTAVSPEPFSCDNIVSSPNFKHTSDIHGESDINIYMSENSDFNITNQKQADIASQDIHIQNGLDSQTPKDIYHIYDSNNENENLAQDLLKKNIECNNSAKNIFQECSTHNINIDLESHSKYIIPSDDKNNCDLGSTSTNIYSLFNECVSASESKDQVVNLCQENSCAFEQAFNSKVPTDKCAISEPPCDTVEMSNEVPEAENNDSGDIENPKGGKGANKKCPGKTAKDFAVGTVILSENDNRKYIVKSYSKKKFSKGTIDLVEIKRWVLYK